MREMKLPAALLTSPVSGPAAEDVLDHLVHGRRIADIDAVARDLAAGLVGQLERGGVAHRLAPPADEDLGAKLEKLRRHLLAEPGAAAGHQNALRFEDAILEHGRAPCVRCFLPVSGEMRRGAKPGAGEDDMASVLDRFRLDGQVALITGGARGIGRATAEAFVAAGARAVLLDRDGDEASAALRATREMPRRMRSM